MKKLFSKMALTVLITVIAIQNAHSQSGFQTQEYPMMKGVSKNIKNGWSATPLITVGETNNAGEDVNLLEMNYRPTGIFDGIGAIKKGNTVNLYINNELGDDKGYTYYLSNGTPLIGARMINVKVDANKRNVKDIDLAYTEVLDRAGNFVTSADQINEGSAPGTIKGFNRFCSGYSVSKNYHGFTKDIFFAGEETTSGQFVALDINAKQLHVVPMAGRGGFENATSLDNNGSNKVVLMFGDDRSSAPIILYIGEKGSTADGYNPSKSFLKNNGLANGHLYVWVNDSEGETSPLGFYGTGASRTGKFVRIDHYNSALAGASGYDALGFANQETQDAAYDAIGHFEFTRPEDLATNPNDGTQVALNSTGNDALYGGAEKWGVVYKIDLDDDSFFGQLDLPLDDINNIVATVTILYDGNDAGGGIVSGSDYGIRSPDNIDWADNGYLYIQEDRSYSAGFGLTSGIEASVWQLDPNTGAIERILEMDRNAVPFQQTDGSPSDIGNWESSGILDVTSLFNTEPGETLLVLDVQAHSLTSGPVGGSTDLVEGGQILLASKKMSGLVVRTAAEENGIQKVENKLKAFPNPADEMIYLNVVSNIAMYDVNGNLVKTAEGVDSINVSALPAGIYFINAENGESIKVVVE